LVQGSTAPSANWHNIAKMVRSSPKKSRPPNTPVGPDVPHDYRLMLQHQRNPTARISLYIPQCDGEDNIELRWPDGSDTSSTGFPAPRFYRVCTKGSPHA
jgi:hypothetical protein